LKPKLLYEELTNIITGAGIKVRKDILKSRGGYCIIDNNQLVILNKMLPVETHCRILAKCIGELNIQNSTTFIVPAVREFIENELSLLNQNTNIELNIS